MTDPSHASELMAQWQPARIRPYHWKVASECNIPLTKEQAAAAKRKIFLITEAAPKDYMLAFYRSSGCDAERFFMLHPEGAAEFCDGDKRVIVCEHEILTD